MKKFILLSCLIISIGAQAQDRYFARTYNSNVLQKGGIDLEFWHTSRFGHAGQFFHAQDQRIEAEFGLGKGLQTAFYFNNYQKRFSTGPDGTEVSNEIGFSNEWKLKLSDPVANKLGSALYFEAGFKGGDELELETKLILEKVIRKNIFAFNGTVEFEKEFEWEDNAVKSEGWQTPVEFSLAYMNMVTPKLGLGVEVVNKNDIAKGQGWMNSVLFAGPTLNFRGGRFFIILNYLPQLSNLHKTVYAPLNKNLTGHERTEARILVGISL